MTPAERQAKIEANCTALAQHIMRQQCPQGSVEQIAEAIGKSWASTTLAAEGAARREAAEKCADIADTFGEVEIRDAINEHFNLNNW